MPEENAPYKIEVEDGKIYSRLRGKKLVATPEERVRQAYLNVLIEEYGYGLGQMAEEQTVTGRGTGGARADFVIWKTAQDKKDEKAPYIVVECKADNVTIRERDYAQGDRYARLANAPFFVTHNNQETRYWRVKKKKMPGHIEEIENIPHADDSEEEVEKLLSRLKTFEEKEFADLLHQCHNVIRNRQHLGPAAAFDEIAKILFMKVTQERRMRRAQARENLFRADFVREQQQRLTSPLDVLFDETKTEYADDRIFEDDEEIELKFNTAVEIIERLERYDLSATSEDIKGIAFERFLGRTFRGENGQFFTPRTIVEFMIRMVDPQEGEAICDPASGSGGFLIRFFEIVREKIAESVDAQYRAFKEELDTEEDLDEEERAARLQQKYDGLVEEAGLKQEEAELGAPPTSTRLGRLANRCIYGTDANDRMARTSKMNMIMHGDGHGGVHHHNGLLNVNGIFEERFDIILTNPPFGAKVEKDDEVTPGEVALPDAQRSEYERIYEDAYRRARRRTEATVGEAIGSLFDLGRSHKTGNLLKQKTEILFIERCLNLLKPGGRLGIVLPEGIFNNPSLQYVRTFCEDRARLRAVVSLPQEAFHSADTTVKTSLLFLQKFTEEQKARYDRLQEEAAEEVDAKYADEIQARTDRLGDLIKLAKEVGDDARRKALRKARRDYKKEMDAQKREEARALLKKRFSYPVFLYDAEHVGITATGGADANELYRAEDAEAPPGLEATCLEQYRAFEQDASAFFLDAQA